MNYNKIQVYVHVCEHTSNVYYVRLYQHGVVDRVLIRMDTGA